MSEKGNSSEGLFGNLHFLKNQGVKNQSGSKVLWHKKSAIKSLVILETPKPLDESNQLDWGHVFEGFFF